MKIRRPIWVLLDAACWLALGGVVPACAADGPWSGSVALSSDYVLRGVSQSYGGAALQAGLSYRSVAGWFAGGWVSNADPFPFYGNVAEVNVYGGYGWAMGRDFSGRASYTRYAYAFDGRPRPYGYGEMSVSLGFRDLVAATVSYEPDTVRFTQLGYVRGRPSSSYEVNARLPLAASLALTGSVGYYDLTRLYGLGYWSGSGGVNWVHGRLTLDLTRFVSDATVTRLYDEASADGRWVASASWRF